MSPCSMFRSSRWCSLAVLLLFGAAFLAPKLAAAEAQDDSSVALPDSWKPGGFADGRTRFHLVTELGGKISYPGVFQQIHGAVGIDLWLAHLGIEASFSFDAGVGRADPGPDNASFPPDNFTAAGRVGLHGTLPIHKGKFFLLLGGGFVGGGMMVNGGEVLPGLGAYQSVTFYAAYGMDPHSGFGVLIAGGKRRSGALGVRVEQRQFLVPSAEWWEHSTTISLVVVPFTSGGRTPYYP